MEAYMERTLVRGVEEGGVGVFFFLFFVFLVKEGITASIFE